MRTQIPQESTHAMEDGNAWFVCSEDIPSIAVLLLPSGCERGGSPVTCSAGLPEDLGIFELQPYYYLIFRGRKGQNRLAGSSPRHFLLELLSSPGPAP